MIRGLPTTAISKYEEGAILFSCPNMKTIFCKHIRFSTPLYLLAESGNQNKELNNIFGSL